MEHPDTYVILCKNIIRVCFKYKRDERFSLLFVEDGDYLWSGFEYDIACDGATTFIVRSLHQWLVRSCMLLLVVEFVVFVPHVRVQRVCIAMNPHMHTYVVRCYAMRSCAKTQYKF